MMSGQGRPDRTAKFVWIQEAGASRQGSVAGLVFCRGCAMIRAHERVLVEARRQATAEREVYRQLLERERRGLIRYRSAPRVAPPEEHRASLQEAKRLARESLDAHRRALEENPWILQLVALYEQLQALRRAKGRRKEKTEQPVAQELLPSPQTVG